MSNAKLLEKLSALGVCKQGIRWAKEKDTYSKQRLWEEASPLDMLWILRRTMTSYKSKKIRTLARCLVDIVDTIDVDQDYGPGEVRARGILLAFADGRAETEDIYSLHLSLNYKSGRFYGVLATLSKELVEWTYAMRNPRLLSHEELATNAFFEAYGPMDISWSKEIVLRHFPKPPRLK